MRTMIASTVVLAALSSAANGQAAADQPKIIVDGYGEVKTMPDIATITYTLRGEGTTSDEAVKAMVAQGLKIHAMLHTVEASVAPQSDEVRVSPVKGSACKDREYDNDDQLSKGACAVVGYIATQDVELRTSNIKDAGTMVGLVGRGGAYNARIQGFSISDVRPAKQQAMAAALADAQSRATVLAKGSHVGLGPILTVVMGGNATPVTVLSSQEVKLSGTTRTEDLINSLPQGFARPIAVNVNPEPITTSATVGVTYAIAR